jgi:hypothetical protein
LVYGHGKRHARKHLVMGFQRFSKLSGDIPLYIILADNAAIGYLPDVMSVYRRNSAGLSYTDSIDWAFLQNRIEIHRKPNQHTEGKYQQQIYPFLSGVLL